MTNFVDSINGTKTAMPVSNNVPLFGGMTFLISGSLGENITFEVTEQTIQVGFNIDVEPGDDSDDMDKKVDEAIAKAKEDGETSESLDKSSPAEFKLSISGFVYTAIFAATNIEFEVYFNANGGYFEPEQYLIIRKGIFDTDLTQPSNPSKADDDRYEYVFLGWSNLPDGEVVAVEPKTEAKKTSAKGSGSTSAKSASESKTKSTTQKPKTTPKK